jgi:hypothetical protein
VYISIFRLIFEFVEALKKMKWPASHHKCSEKSRNLWLEIACCAREIPLEILTLIIGDIIMIKSRNKLEPWLEKELKE